MVRRTAEHCGKEYGSMVFDILDGTHRLLYDEDKWIKGPFAVDAIGTPVSEEDEHACAWCLIGAMALTTRELGFRGDEVEFHAHQYLRDALAEFTKSTGHSTSSAGWWNDRPETKHSDVLFVLKQAGREVMIDFDIW